MGSMYMRKEWYNLNRMVRQMEEMHAIRSLHGYSSAMGWNRPEEKLNSASAKWSHYRRDICQIYYILPEKIWRIYIVDWKLWSPNTTNTTIKYTNITWPQPNCRITDVIFDIKVYLKKKTWRLKHFHQALLVMLMANIMPGSQRVHNIFGFKKRPFFSIFVLPDIQSSRDILVILVMLQVWLEKIENSDLCVLDVYLIWVYID